MVSVVSATLQDQAIRELKARADVEYVEEDVILYAVAQTMAWGVDRIDADLAWPGGNTGRGVKVAILDTGIDYDHPDLPVAGGINFVGTKDGSTAPADWNDNHGHGTHCAGIVAARNNTVGAVGVAPDALLYGVKVLADNGSGYTSDVIQGLDWCAANGIKVASMSLAGGGTTSLKNACDSAYARGVVVVAAAGNNAGAVMYPAAYPSVIAVSATDSRNLLASFSNYGPKIELAAPGVGIYSTYKNGGYASMSGTSMACPHVAGAAALAWASGLSSSAAVRERLTSTAEDLGTAGRDNSFGFGLVDAQKAAGVATTPTPTPTDNPPSVDITAPAQGATVSGTVAVKATASDDKGVTQVEFLVNGARIGLDTQGVDGWSASWNTTTTADGQRTITAKATDTAGASTADTITVTVGNTDAGPTVQITNPRAGTTVSGDVTITAAASDDKGVVSVRFTIDGGTAITDTDGRDGWSAEWDTTAFTNGVHTVAAVATDTKEQTAGHSVGVTVSNATPSQAQTASVESITYSLTGFFSRDLAITLHIDNDAGNPVANGMVTLAIYRNGTLYVTRTGRTATNGSATIRISNAPFGTYQTRITSVIAAGLSWDGVTPQNTFTK